MNEEMTHQEYKDKLAQVASLAVAYAKTGSGFYQMREAFNELCEKSGANKGINDEATIGRRILMVKTVCIETIPSLSKAAIDRLEEQLKDIANDYSPARSRGFRR